MYFTAGPLTAFFPISGEMAITFSLFFTSCSRRSGRAVMGPMLETGFPGAIITDLDRLMASIAAGFAKALDAFSYLISLTISLPRYLTQNSCKCISPLVVVTILVDTSPSVAGMIWAVRERSEERRVGKECRSRWSP